MLSWIVGKEKAEWMVGKYSTIRSRSRLSNVDWGCSSSYYASATTSTWGFTKSTLTVSRRPSAASRAALRAEWDRLCPELESKSCGVFSEAVATKLRRVKCDEEAAHRVSMVIVLNGDVTIPHEDIHNFFGRLKDKDKELIIVDTVRSAFLREQAKLQREVVCYPVEFEDDEPYEDCGGLPWPDFLKTVGCLMASGQRVIFLDGEELVAVKELGMTMTRRDRLDVLNTLGNKAKLSR